MRRLGSGLVAGVVALGVVAGGFEAQARGGDGGARWEVAQAGELSTTAHLTSVTTAGPRAAWAVGHQRFSGVAEGVVMRWDGSEWRQDTAPGLPEVQYWWSVDAASPSSVWAYGWGGPDGEVAAHFNGRSWNVVDLPALDGESYGFAELAAVPRRTFLAGERRISTYAHGEWSAYALEPGVFINDIQARTASDAWAVGGFARVGQEQRPVVLHWNGRGWTDVSPGDPDLQPANVYVESARSVWLSGHDASAPDAFQPKLMHWNGHRWRDVTGPVEDIYPQAIGGDGRGTVWFSGDPSGWEGPPVFWRHDGRRWTRVTGASVPEGQTQAYEITDLAPAGRTGHIWAVGSYEIIVGPHSSERYELIERYRRR